MNSPAQEIKEKLDIVQLIRSYITLLPAGKNWKAVCPFHKEKTPSFIVSPDRQTWHCFGSCSEGGDIIKFLMKYENLEFYEALKILAEKAGIELKKSSPAEYKQFGILYDINEAAKNFFEKELTASPEVLNYVRNRGLRKEIAEEFELGFAPNNFDKLIIHLTQGGFNIKDVERSGLAFKTERGGYIDRFRGRLMFPIHNTFGKVVGFSGRVLPQFETAGSNVNMGKYVNSPETPIFNKSRIVYGLHKTKNHIKELNSVVLVEGQMDFLMLYQDGVKNVVATSGTALTHDHLITLRRFTSEVVLSFDNDEAGVKAAERSIDLAGANDFSVKLLTLGDYKDPAEAVEKSPGAALNFLKETRPAIEFYFDRYLKNSPSANSKSPDFNLSNLKKNLRIILAKIKNLASPIEKSHWLKELSNRTKLNENSLAEEMEQLEAGNAQSGKSTAGNASQEISRSALGPKTRRELIAERILSLVMAKEELKKELADHLEHFPEDYAMIIKSITNETKITEEPLLNLINIIALRSPFEVELLGEEKIEDEFHNLLRQIELEYLKGKRGELAYGIREAESVGDENKAFNLLKDFEEISRAITE